MPDPVLTPGVVDPQADVKRLCEPGYTAKIRLVTTATKKAVVAAYRAKHPDWPAPPYEIDHFISLEIGGLNDVKNLWPQPIAEARKKDVIETRFHRMMCKGKMTLQEAQIRIHTWWLEDQ